VIGWLRGRLAGAESAAPRMSANDETAVTLDRVLDAVAGYGPVWPDTAAGRMLTREAALGYPALMRAVTLISSTSAQLIACGGLRVHDSSGALVTTRAAAAARALVEESPDGVIDGHAWIEDYASDYLIDGNALVAVDRSFDGRPLRLSRLDSSAAQATRSESEGRVVFEAPDDETGELLRLDQRDVVLARWPRLRRRRGGYGTSRAAFGPSPVSLLSTAIQIGIAGNGAILEWYQSGQRAPFGVSVKNRLQPEQLAQYQKNFRAISGSRDPLILDDDARFTNLSANEGDRAAQPDLRDFQISDIGRVYGVPGPVLNQQLTSWGSGIDSLAKIFWRFGLAQHVNRLLAPLGHRLLARGQRFRVDPLELLRGDWTSMANLINALREDAQRGQIATTEELRMFVGWSAQPEFGELKGPTGSQRNEKNGIIGKTEAESSE